MHTHTVWLVVFLTSLSALNVLCTTGHESSRLFPTSKVSNNPDAYLTTQQIITRYGYPSEAHIVQTEDGYLLTVFRIPYSKHSQTRKPGQPVFLQHGLLLSSVDWVLDGNDSLAFTLSDAGYDVWLGNVRGNSYSRDHIKYTPKDKNFWDFSWHEMGMYDLPAVLTYIGHCTNQMGNILYLGHSMGTTMFFIYASKYSNASSTVKMMVAMAPPVFMNDVRTPLKYITPFANEEDWLLTHLGQSELMPNDDLMKILADIGCDQDMAEMHLCANLLFLLFGFDKEQCKTENLPVILNHEPDTASAKTLTHYGQVIKSHGRFAEFDYGHNQNLKRYGTKIPPAYNVSAITLPICLISSLNDWFVGRPDVVKLSGVLPNVVKDYVVPYKKFNHLDYSHAKNAPEQVWKPMLQVMAQYG